MRNVVHTSLTISKKEEKEVIILLKNKYYKGLPDKKMFMDAIKTHFWWRELLNKIPRNYNEERVRKMVEGWAEEIINVKVKS
jgi:hypothetical protein